MSPVSTPVSERLVRLETLALALATEIASLRAEIESGTTAPEGATPVSIGTRIQVARVRLGMKRPALAVEAGVSYPYLAEIETGRKQAPVRTLQRIADVLGTTVAELVTA